MFDALKVAAQKNVDTRNGHANLWTQHSRFSLREPDHGRNVFTIADTFGHPDKPWVKFTLQDETITVRRSWAKEDRAYTLTLNNDGQCRFSKGGDEFEIWQVLRDALEELLFRPLN
jgi:hypothetical protein